MSACVKKILCRWSNMGKMQGHGSLAGEKMKVRIFKNQEHWSVFQGHRVPACVCMYQRAECAYAFLDFFKSWAYICIGLSHCSIPSLTETRTAAKGQQQRTVVAAGGCNRSNECLSLYLSCSQAKYLVSF